MYKLQWCLANSSAFTRSRGASAILAAATDADTDAGGAQPSVHLSRVCIALSYLLIDLSNCLTSN